MKSIDYFSRLSTPYLIAIGLVFNLLVGLLDYLTGSHISVSIFYLIPICFVTWFINRKAGYFMSVVSIATIPLVLYMQDDPVNTVIGVWNLLLVFGFFAVVTFLSSKLREHMEAREKLVEELQTAIKEINKLSGMLPICVYCKKIRDDEGYWNILEEYLSNHSEANFSHCICPDCQEKKL